MNDNRCGCGKRRGMFPGAPAAPAQECDGCLGSLPKINWACCGHGETTPYVAFRVANEPHPHQRFPILKTDPMATPAHTFMALYGKAAAVAFDELQLVAA